MSKVGRPSKYNEETVNAILGILRNGDGRMAACRVGGICHDTFITWIETYPDFSESVKRAEAEGRQTLKDEAIQSIREAHKVQKQWQAGAWIAERMFPDEFAKREPNASPDVNININVRYEDADTDD